MTSLNSLKVLSSIERLIDFLFEGHCIFSQRCREIHQVYEMLMVILLGKSRNFFSSLYQHYRSHYIWYKIQFITFFYIEFIECTVIRKEKWNIMVYPFPVSKRKFMVFFQMTIKYLYYSIRL